MTVKRPEHILGYADRRYTCSCGQAIYSAVEDYSPLRTALYRHAEHVQSYLDLYLNINEARFRTEWSRGFEYDTLSDK